MSPRASSIVGLALGIAFYASILVALRLIELANRAPFSNSAVLAVFVSEAALGSVGVAWGVRRLLRRGSTSRLAALSAGVAVGVLLADASGLLVGWMTAIPGAATFPG